MLKQGQVCEWSYSSASHFLRLLAGSSVAQYVAENLCMCTVCFPQNIQTSRVKCNKHIAKTRKEIQQRKIRS